MKNVTDSFVEYIYELGNRELPEAVRERAEQVLLDYLGVTYAGASLAGNSLGVYIQSSQGNCGLLGYEGESTNAVIAAFINGFNAHRMELDDGHRFGMLHLGAVIIPAVLAIAEEEAIIFQKILRGIVAGYEAAVRVALAIQPDHKKRGYHTTGTCGTIGAAIGCAVALGMDKIQMKAVLSAAATSASGLLEIQENTSQIKAYNAAHAAMAGVTASLIGKSGMCGPDDILGGDRGFLAIHSTTVNTEKLFQSRDYYEIERIYVKPYAACRHCHSAMEAAMNLREKFQIDEENIEEICIDTYQLAIRGHDHKEINGVASAKLSMPYCVSAAYVLNSGGEDSFSEYNLRNMEILRLANRVVLQEKSEFTELSSTKRIAEVSIHTKQGESYSSRVDYAKGDPENPMTKDEIEAKFIELMLSCGRREKAEMILKLFHSGGMTSKKLFEIL